MSKEAPRSRRSLVKSVPKVSVNSYYSNRSSESPVPASPFNRTKVKKSARRLFSRALDIVLVLVLLVCLGYSLVVKPSSKVILSNTTYHPAINYTYFINSQISSIKDRNKITFDQDGLINSLKTSFPEINTASIELPILGQRPIVRISVGTPAFFLSSGGNNYLISSNGVAVDYKNTYLKLPKLITVTDNSGFSISKGKQVLSSANVAFLQTLAAELSLKQIPIKNLVLSKSPEEIDLYTTDYSYYTKFFMGGDAVLQSGQYLAARNKFNPATGPATYLDVRVAGKIFYM